MVIFVTNVTLIGLMQLSLPGSQPTSALRSHTARIGYFRLIFFGSIAGLRFLNSARNLSRFKLGMGSKILSMANLKD